MIDQIRTLGGKVLLFEEGDVIPAMSTCIEHLKIDMFIGIGGAPEGVLAAVGIKSLGGDMQADYCLEQMKSTKDVNKWDYLIRNRHLPMTN